MSNIDTGGPAFPLDFRLVEEMSHAIEASIADQKKKVEALAKLGMSAGGMNLRQYAAIKLRVPNSGTDWLDEMIVQSLRDEFAAKAPFPYPEEWKRDYCNQRGYRGEAQCMADWSCDWADAILKAREGGAA